MQTSSLANDPINPGNQMQIKEAGQTAAGLEDLTSKTEIEVNGHTSKNTDIKVGLFQEISELAKKVQNKPRLEKNVTVDSTKHDKPLTELGFVEFNETPQFEMHKSVEVMTEEEMPKLQPIHDVTSEQMGTTKQTI